MKRLPSALLAAAVLLLVIPNAFAKQIYTWTDENGVVHFVDRPPDNPDAQTRDAPEAYRPGSVGAEAAAPEAPEPAEAVGDTTEPELSAAEAKRQELAEKRAERQARAAEDAAICTRARAQLAAVEPSRRVFYENEEGETIRMDDDERIRLIEESEALIEKHCR